MFILPFANSACIDTYEKPSVKESERERRDAVSGANIIISVPDQRRDGSFQRQLDHESFKNALFIFLVEDWVRNRYALSMNGREIYLGVGENCYRLRVENGKVS